MQIISSKVFFTFILLVSLQSLLYAQTVCNNVVLEIKEQPAVDFVFDDMRDYFAGITKEGVITLKVDVEDLTPSLNSCKWKLIMEVNNSPELGTNADEWVRDFLYTSNPTPTSPQIDILSIKVSNSCNTPIYDNFQIFDLNGDEIDIIKDLNINNPTTPCASNVIVNGAGNYKTNYDQYIFKVSFKVDPAFTYSPGIYHLKIDFKLIEDI